MQNGSNQKKQHGKAQILLLAIIIGFGILSFVAAQDIIPISTKFRTKEGFAVTGQHSVTFNIYSNAIGGDAIWSEMHLQKDINKGVASFNLGETISLDRLPSNDLWVGVTLDSDSEMTPRLKLPNYARKSSSGSEVPVGAVFPFAGEVPSGWLECDGSQVSVQAYPALYQSLGDTFGAGGDGTFTLPDLRGRTIVGTGQGLGLSRRQLAETGGEEEHRLTKDEMPSHSHSCYQAIWDGGSRYDGHSTPLITPPSGQTETTSAGGDQPHNTMPPYACLTWAIRGK